MVSPEAAAAVVSALPPAPVFSEMVSPAVVVSVDFFVSVVLAAALVALLVRHSRRRPVPPYREVPIDDVERQPRTLRPGYEAPQRW